MRLTDHTVSLNYLSVHYPFEPHIIHRAFILGRLLQACIDDGNNPAQIPLVIGTDGPVTGEPDDVLGYPAVGPHTPDAWAAAIADSLGEDTLVSTLATELKRLSDWV
jgi:hypothetical protein